MKHLIVLTTILFVVTGCGVADVTSGAGELADTGDRLVAAIEEANEKLSGQNE